jgi:hypothetical protein
MQPQMNTELHGKDIEVGCPLFRVNPCSSVAASSLALSTARAPAARGAALDLRSFLIIDSWEVRTMTEDKRDKTKVAPSGAEETEPAKPLKSVPPGEPANATTAEIPGTGEIIRDKDGKEIKRVVTT